MSREPAEGAARDGPQEFLRRIEALEEALAACRRSEEAARDSLRVFQGIFEVCKEPIFLLEEASGAILEANPAACARYGYSHLELVSLSFADISVSASPDVSRFENGLDGELRQEHRGRDGRAFPVEIAAGSFTHQGKRVVIVFVQDLTRRNRAEEALRRSEARYRGIVEDQTELIRRSLPDGRLTFANEAFCRFFGLDREQALGKPFIADVPDKDRGVMDAALAKLRPEEPAAGFEHRVALPNGSIRWLFTTCRAFFDASGAVVEYQTVSRSITKRKRMEEKLRESEEFLRLIIDTVPSPIFVKNRDAVFTLVNKSLADIYGCTPEKLVGARGVDFNPDAAEVARAREEDLKVLDSGRPVFIPRKTITNSRGEKRWYSNTKLQLPGKDQVLGVAVDITEIVEAEKERERIERQASQAQKMQALGTLAGGVAHDFNNMIFAILGFAQLALKQIDDNPKLVEYLEQIRSAGLRSSQLVRRILAFSRQEDRENSPVNMTALTREVCDMLAATLPPETVIRIRDETENDAVLGDSGRLHQVMLNLCSNAAHAMRDGGGSLTITLRNETVRGDCLEAEVGPGSTKCLHVVVRDTGVGMDQDVADRVFEPFFTTKGPGEGTGLGLSVAHGIVKSHGGDIKVESERDRGTAFHLFFPEYEGAAYDGEEGVSAVRGGGERILVVDDEPSLTDMLDRLLTGLGYRVVAGNSPLEALKLFMEAPDRFDLALVNQTMPMMRGRELAGEMLAVRPDTPILLMTGYAESEVAEQALGLGVRDVLVKPVSERRLAEAVRRALAPAASDP